MWLAPNIVSDLIWDYNMGINNNMAGVLKEILAKSLKSTLTPEETKVNNLQ
jgi:hypothetical protein